MKWLAGIMLIGILAAQPVSATGAEFDPDQPFKGAGQRLLESFLGQALQALDDQCEDQGHSASTRSSVTRAAKTSVR